MFYFFPPKVPPRHEADCCAGQEERQRKLPVIPDLDRLGRVNGEEEESGNSVRPVGFFSFQVPKTRQNWSESAKKTTLAKHVIFCFFERFIKM